MEKANMYRPGLGAAKNARVVVIRLLFVQGDLVVDDDVARMF